MASTLQGHTACQVMTMALQMPDGSVQHQVYLVPFYGPIPASTTVLTSLQQLQQLQPRAGPTLIPSSQPQASALQLVSPPIQAGIQKRTVDSSGKMNKVDANGSTNETKESGESSAESPSDPSAAIVEECSKTSESMVDHDAEDETNVISNVQQVPVEKDETVAVPQPTEVIPIKVVPPPTPVMSTEEFPSLGGPRSRENFSSPGEICREESLHTSSESGESSQSDFPKEWTKAYVYKTMKRTRVRADKTPTSDEVGILEKGEKVHVVFIEGRKGRIVYPFNGWVSMRKKKERQLAQTFSNMTNPTVILSSLDSSLKKEKDVLNFLRSQDLRPTRCIWQKKDDFVTVYFTEHKDASKLVRGKFFCNDTQLTATWADSYAKMVEL